ncbi:LADA_0A08064g1_1 [Lachancea dasiensis]|uniref:LADA_0A08064g1_1 n=1 Tax=Lachancea dasiensis TaxID=1072105 RepID=A0A1G4IQ10_9SACH|nr:LADA_0A08064g1_1 [Lachancea dasiensis]
MDDEGQLAIYKRSLIREIENKEYFLQQTTELLAELREREPDSGSNEEPKLWEEFLKRPMFFPDRSDPVGVSLAFCENRNRLNLNRQFLESNESQSLTMLQQVLEIQESLNQGLATLLELLSARLTGEMRHQRASNDENDARPEITDSIETQNNKLWDILNLLVGRFVAVDLCPPDADPQAIASEMRATLTHMIKKSGVVYMKNFQGPSSGLYRLLLKAKLVSTSEDGATVKLQDFSEEF